MDNTETGEGGLIVLLWQICNLQTIEVSKAVFGTKCLNIFATGCSYNLYWLSQIWFLLFHTQHINISSYNDHFWF